MEDEKATDSKQQRQLSIAYHEAGHAVVAHILGFKIRSVTILPQALTDLESANLGKHRFAEGKTDIDFGTAEVNEQVTNIVYLKPWAMSYLAGAIAQLRGAPQGVRPGDAELDRILVQREAAKFLGASAPMWIESVTSETSWMLAGRHVWAAVTVVANALVKRRTLDAADFLGEVSPPLSLRRRRRRPGARH